MALQILDSLAEKTRQQISAYCRWECRHAFTQNDEEFLKYTRRIYTTFYQLREEILHVTSVGTTARPQEQSTAPIPVHHGPYAAPPESPSEPAPSDPPVIVIPDEISAFCTIAGRGYRVNPTNLVKALEEHDNELKLISGAAAYFKIAWKRMFDLVPLCIENQFLVAFAAEIRERLRDDLGLIGDSGFEKCQEYAVEDEALKEMKDSLVTMKDTLVKAVKIVRGI